MGRPAKHTADDFVDAAIALFREHGLRAVTLAAVATRAGAANGSVYHRFPDRQSLLAAMWSRTTSRFHAGYADVIGRPTVSSAVEVAVWVVDWCRDHPGEAQVLSAGPGTFVDSAARATELARTRRDLTRHVTALASQTTASPEQIGFVLIRLPLAVAQPYLQAGRLPGRRDSALVRSLAELVLGQGEAAPKGVE